jgi:peptide subunit release factor 1 (eRF1)
MKKELTTANNIKNRKNRSNVERILKIIIENLRI